MANKKPSPVAVSPARKAFPFGEGGGRRLTDEVPRKAVFFDRDGTLNVDIHYLHRPEDFVWIPGA